MPEACSFRQVEEKHVSVEVEHMVWSPRMDLLALANVQAEVRLVPDSPHMNLLILSNVQRGLRLVMVPTHELVDTS